MKPDTILQRTAPARRARIAPIALGGLALLQITHGPLLKAEVITAPQQHFMASPGQSVFGTTNLNVFKQFLFEWNPRPIGIGWIEDPAWFPGQYGGKVTYSTDGAFGLEFGLCVGGNVNFDLAFQPQITMPDRLVTGIGLPLTVTAPQSQGSHFVTTFDGIGQAYADLIMDARVGVDYRVCLGECAEIPIGLDTRSVLPLSERCDPSINQLHPPKAGIELASVNRGNNGLLRIRTLKQGLGGTLDFGYETNTPGTTNGSTISLMGKISLSNPRIDTDSTNSIFCQSGIICSSGSADVFGLALDVGNFIEELLPDTHLPEPFDRFKFKNEFNYKGLSASYVLADLNVGPVVKLKMDHEMDWDLWVTAMTFSSQVIIGGQPVTNLAQLFGGVLPAGRYHLSNVGANALPLIELTNTTPVQVTVSYKVVPRFKTKVSTPIIGRIDYELLSASAAFHGGPVNFGPYEAGPALKGRKEFDIANVTAYSGEKNLQTTNVGTITFTMTAAGPPSFRWTGSSGGAWETANNWTETSTSLHTLPTTGGDVVLPTGQVNLSSSATIASLCIAAAAQLNLAGASSALTLGSGFVDNKGVLLINQNATFNLGGLTGTNAMLCGTGDLQINGGSLGGYGGPGDFLFVNYNHIAGGGDAMTQYGRNGGASTIRNLGSFRATTPGSDLRLSASRIQNGNRLDSISGARLAAFAQQLETTPGSFITSDGAGSRSSVIVDFAEHAGEITARNGGSIEIRKFNAPQVSEWNGGQALNEDKGIFHAIDAGSLITLQGVNMKGGCFLMNGGGALQATNVNFTGSVLNIGGFDENGSDGSGFLTFLGASHLTNVTLNNYGTLFTPAQVTVVGSKIFANHGTIQVPLGGSMQIPTISIDPNTPGASPEVLTRPGTINASTNTLLGGTWRIAGSLSIAGASFTSTGADPGSGTTSSGYVADGVAHAGNPADDTAKALSYGRPANVILEGSNWSFPAILPLANNGGLFSLTNGAVFAAQGSFTNHGKVLVGGSGVSSLTIPGSYVQDGSNALTLVTDGGFLASTLGDYQIMGGQVLSKKGVGMFGLFGADTSLSGVSLRIASHLHWYTNQVGFFDAEPLPCAVDLSTDGIQGQLPTFTQIERIDADASVTFHGDNITFRDLSSYLRQVNGHLHVTGETLNRGNLWIQNQVNPFDPFINNGEVEVAGQYSTLEIDRDYVQASGTTTVGRGATLKLQGDLTVTGGEFIVEIGARSRAKDDFNYFDGIVSLNGTENLGNSLKIRFVGLAGVDVGDSWIIIQGSNVQLSGPVNYEGITLPSFTQLVAIPESRGLRIAVVPDGPTTAYTAWLNRYSIPIDQWTPDQDFDHDGLSDGSEFMFGSDPTVPNSLAAQKLQAGSVDDGNGGKFFEITFERPGGDLLPDASYRVYLATNLTDSPVVWREGLFSVVSVAAGASPNTQRVTMRSTTAFIAEHLFARIGGSILGYVPPAGSTPDDPLGNPGDLADERGHIGKVIYYRIQGDATSAGGSVYGGPFYADRSSLKRTVVHAGAVPDTDNQYIVKVTIFAGLPNYPAVDGAFGLRSSELTDPEFGSVSFTVEAYP